MCVCVVCVCVCVCVCCNQVHLASSKPYEAVAEAVAEVYVTRVCCPTIGLTILTDCQGIHVWAVCFTGVYIPRKHILQQQRHMLVKARDGAGIIGRRMWNRD